MQKKIIPLTGILLVSFILNAYAQVQGWLVSNNGKPVAFANIALYRALDTTMVKTAVTGNDGAFIFERPAAGKYLLLVSSIGFVTRDTTFRVDSVDKLVNLGTITVTESSSSLGNVTIRAQKPFIQQQQGGLVINVESSPLAKGSSALEVLERSPGVIINRRNSDISLNGKSGVAVLLDGRLMHIPVEQLLSFLQGISANDIATIELLTSPSAAYDAEGSAGVINIVTKKSRQKGTNGSATITGGYGVGEKGSAAVSVARFTGKWRLYGSYNFSHDNTYYKWSATATEVYPFLGGKNNSFVSSVTRAVINSHNANAGAEILLPHNFTLGANVSYGNSRAIPGIENNGRYVVEPDSLLLLHVDIDGVNSWNNIVSSLYAEKKLSDRHTLKAGADYLYYYNNNPSQAQTSFVNSQGKQVDGGTGLFGSRQRGYAQTAINVVTGKADYEGKLNKNFQLLAGIKGTYTSSRSSAGVQVLDTTGWKDVFATSNHITMREGIGAVYTSANITLPANTSLVLGARYEYSNTEMKDANTGENIVTRKLGRLFPNLFFSKKMGNGNEWQLSYTARISRPSYNDLASFITYNSPTSASTGNPFLLASTSAIIKAAFVHKGYSAAFLYTGEQHPIERYQIVLAPTGNMNYVSPQNLLYRRSFDLQVVAPVRVNNWWRMSNTLTGGIRIFKENYTAYPASKTYPAFVFNSTQSFTLPKGWGMELSGFYNSLFYNGTRKTQGFGAVNFGVKKELANNKGTLGLAITDVFTTMRVTSYFGALTQEAFDLKSQVLGRNESSVFPVIKLSYTRQFGNSKVQRVNKEFSGEEKGRVNLTP